MLSEQEKTFSPSVIAFLKQWGAAIAAGLLVLGTGAIWIRRRRSKAGSSELAPVLGSADS
jgi:LPXTG-motif cell wall-anchored protein